MKSNPISHQQVATYLIIILLLFSNVILAFYAKPTEMGIFTTACIACIILVKIESLKSFKGLGIQAELKETLSEANATKEELQQLMAVLEQKEKELERKIKQAETRSKAFTVALG